jgi:hypothetical protein
MTAYTFILEPPFEAAFLLPGSHSRKREAL